VQPGFFIPSSEFRRPALQVGPHQVAQLANFLLGIKLGPQIHEVKEGPQAEAHHKMLAIVEGKNASGMLFREAGIEQVAVALRCLLTMGEILLA